MDVVRKIVRTIIVLALVGFGYVGLSSLLRSQWLLSGLAAVALLGLCGLLLLVRHRPQSTRVAIAVVAVLMIGVPPVSFAIDLVDVWGAVPLFAVGAVAILSLAWPSVGLVVIGIEAAILTWAAFRPEQVAYPTIVVFVALALCVHMLSRSLLEALTRVERGRRGLAKKSEELEQVLFELTDAVAQRQNLLNTVRELDAPLIESERGEGVLVVIGYCDRARMQAIQDAVYARLDQRSLRRLIVDISGADFDPAGLGAFIKMLHSLRLVVSGVVVSGMAPQLARKLSQDRESTRLLRQTIRFVHSLQEALVV
jgi:anti-anti-sigma regulatory factor